MAGVHSNVLLMTTRGCWRWGFKGEELEPVRCDASTMTLLQVWGCSSRRRLSWPFLELRWTLWSQSCPVNLYSTIPTSREHVAVEKASTCEHLGASVLSLHPLLLQTLSHPQRLRNLRKSEFRKSLEMWTCLCSYHCFSCRLLRPYTHTLEAQVCSRLEEGF